MAKNNATLTDWPLYLQAGIDPKTGLPKRFTKEEDLHQAVFSTMSLVDRQDALNRYTWFNLPSGLTGQMLETILYYKGQGAFFFNEADENFYFLPYALSGEGIDVYGRFKSIVPLPFRGGTAEDANDAWVKGMEFKPVYDVMIEAPTLESFTKSCVLLKDYSRGTSETIIPRVALQAPILDIESRIIPYLRTALANSTGVGGMVVSDDDAAYQVDEASNTAERAALTGKKWIGIKSKLEIQDITPGATMKAEDFLLSLQSLDNYRLGLYGLDNGGLFEKKAHTLETEEAVNRGNVGLIMQDGLTLRQDFCDIVNSIWGLGIGVMVSETTVGMDLDGNGLAMDQDNNPGPANDDEGGKESDV